MRPRNWLGLSLVGLVCLSGCGPTLYPVKGVVKLDESPVQGATINFVSEDGKQTYAGTSDASGNFNVMSTDGKGLPAGTYKVTVIKVPKVEGAEDAKPGSDAYLKQMTKEGKEGEGSSGPSKMFMKGPMMGPGKTAMGGPRKIKSELPDVYASATSTPLTAKVPSEGQVNIELKSKP